MSKAKITAQRVVITSFIVDLSDVGLNLAVAILTGSAVVLSEFMQGLADLVSSALLVIGIKKSGKPADKLHPFGYGRELYFWTLMSGLITFAITSTASIYIGVGRLLNPQTVDNPLIAVATLSFAVISNGYSTTLSYRRLIGKKGVRDIWEIFKHSSIVETKSTFILDLTGTLSAFIGLISIIFYAVTGDVRFDGVGAIAIGLVMAFLSFTLLRNIKDLIIGQSAPEETEKRIRKVVKKIPEVTSVIDLRTIYIGPSKLLVSLEVNLKDHLTTDEIEEITDKIQRRIKKNVPHVHDTQVELESPKTPESKEEKS